MNSVLLQIAAKYVRWLLVFFAVITLYRGHNEPGGGFIGGLLVSLSVVFYSLAFSAKQARRNIIFQPETNIFIGVLLILTSILPGYFNSGYLMAGEWISISLPVLGELKLGTPFLFDIGVFFAVIGVSLMFFFELKRIGKWK